AFKSSPTNGMIPPTNFKTAIAISIIFPPLSWCLDVVHLYVFITVSDYKNINKFQYAKLHICI
ncbi:hypothetical protein, partial [Bacillus pseudomycoides]|uniref:hypothetical protein n=1 Tax=Bacillus pseudomycoides TaxID=64104 RepID=UPI001C54E6EB